MSIRYTHPLRAAARRGRPARQRGSLGRPLLALAALAILGASAAAITYFATTPRSVAAADAPAAPPPPVVPLFYPIDPFTVTLNNAYGERLLHVGLTLELAQEASRQQVNDFMPVIRSQVLLLLGEQNPETVQTAEGKRTLAADVTRTINAVFEAQGATPVNKVLFNAFVVQ